jgi:hypothetical protein
VLDHPELQPLQLLAHAMPLQQDCSSSSSSTAAASAASSYCNSPLPAERAAAAPECAVRPAAACAGEGSKPHTSAAVPLCVPCTSKRQMNECKVLNDSACVIEKSADES